VLGSGLTVSNNLSWSFLCFVDGSDYTDWSGVGMEFRYSTVPGGWDIYVGELAAGDDSGYLSNLTHVAGPSGLFSSGSLVILRCAGPIGLGNGNYSFSYSINNSAFSSWTTVSLNNGTGHRCGILNRVDAGSPITNVAVRFTQYQCWPI